MPIHYNPRHGWSSTAQASFLFSISQSKLLSDLA